MKKLNNIWKAHRVASFFMNRQSRSQPNWSDLSVKITVMLPYWYRMTSVWKISLRALVNCFNIRFLWQIVVTWKSGKRHSDWHLKRATKNLACCTFKLTRFPPGSSVNSIVLWRSEHLQQVSTTTILSVWCLTSVQPTMHLNFTIFGDKN